MVFGDFVAECLSSIPVHDPNPGGPDGTLTRPVPEDGRAKKKAATSFREAAAYYTGKNLLSHGMLPHYHRRLGA